MLKMIVSIIIYVVIGILIGVMSPNYIWVLSINMVIWAIIQFFTKSYTPTSFDFAMFIISTFAFLFTH